MTSDISDEFGDGFTDEAPEEPAPAAAEITVTGPGISITRPVDEATMSNVIALLFGTTPAARGGGSQSGPVQPVRTQQSQWDDDLTLGEFIVETGAKSFQQKICAAGYYLMNFQHAESFNRDEIRTALADAHEDMPGNFSRDFSDAASKNFIAGKQGESGRYIIPRTGRTAVESHFQDLPKRRPARKAAKRASSRGDAE